MNRIYSLARPQHPSYGLNLAGALVLSLQGFWNSVIYTSTAAPIFRDLWARKFACRLASRRATWHDLEAHNDGDRADNMELRGQYNP